MNPHGTECGLMKRNKQINKCMFAKLSSLNLDIVYLEEKVDILKAFPFPHGP